ncbi:hypothetical protein H0A36_17235 [Endozoicomonas sp. SM1973]|uniref:Uncharacterized protein n=1 Tax=Spartinivicinus marinus TaxID=2994442 RepID=A0A853I1B0_9GAMM|nr:hypothetical protein [Spartinivicinus marinus]MCX4029140.1 hypothetical protein [Spartinivicinus marinus]NYZ67760.1 hypothetical protein [Spartinivicinus marinus]
MSHLEFTIVIKIKSDDPSVAELKMIRKFDETVAEVPVAKHLGSSLVLPYN